jgi:hypothetical protein
LLKKPEKNILLEISGNNPVDRHIHPENYPENYLENQRFCPECRVY